MKPFYYLIALLPFFFMVACTGPDNATDSSATDVSKGYGAFEEASKKPSAKISHEDNWTIVSTTENDERVYWFMAPDIDKVSPAVFKKTIHVKDKNEQETVIVSECEAPRQVCEDLTKQFKTLSEKYKQ